MTRWLWGVVAALVVVGIGAAVWQTGYWNRIAGRPETPTPPPAPVAQAPPPAPAPAPSAQGAPTVTAPNAQSTSPAPAPSASSALPAPAPGPSSPPPAAAPAAQNASSAPAQRTVIQNPAPAPAPAVHTAPPASDAGPAPVAQNAPPQPAPAAQTRPPAAASAPAGATAEQTNEAASGPDAKVMTELASLRPGFSAKDLMAALNDSVIDFASANAEVPASKADLLQRAANQIKRLPPGHVLEIAGYTDGSGNPARNVVLSRQRADAVRAALVKDGVNPGMLVAKGYGTADPIASNDTPEGRARNRRIEFHVVKTP